MKILIADDSRLMRERIRDAVKAFSNVEVVCEAENGAQTLKELVIHNPDLAFIDIRMQEMNGIEVLRKIRELKMKTKICILTNYSFPQYRRKCIELGAEYFFDKNSEFQKISDVIIKLSENDKGKKTDQTPDLN